MDINYVLMARGFVYLAAVINRFSHRVLAWRLPITIEADFCVEVRKETRVRHCKPEISNTDQGSQFTSHAFTSVLLKARIAINDGRPRRVTRQCFGRSPVALGRI